MSDVDDEELAALRAAALASLEKSSSSNSSVSSFNDDFVCSVFLIDACFTSYLLLLWPLCKS